MVKRIPVSDYIRIDQSSWYNRTWRGRIYLDLGGHWLYPPRKEGTIVVGLVRSSRDNQDRSVLLKDRSCQVLAVILLQVGMTYKGFNSPVSRYMRVFIVVVSIKKAVGHVEKGRLNSAVSIVSRYRR